ncbi:hypothetical protein Cadr_000007706 [Camelus dromedarius]|uniref:Uncharacterized protein n=1 Tax=Camelus dromedarius TaxID=9838 RepID=A0A5N4DZ09_CAMDR|nr:hypothetical protein Cadr_000007706 [Camelus dromedarius]
MLSRGAQLELGQKPLRLVQQVFWLFQAGSLATHGHNDLDGPRDRCTLLPITNPPVEHLASRNLTTRGLEPQDLLSLFLSNLPLTWMKAVCAPEKAPRGRGGGCLSTNSQGQSEATPCLQLWPRVLPGPHPRPQSPSDMAVNGARVSPALQGKNQQHAAPSRYTYSSFSFAPDRLQHWRCRKAGHDPETKQPLESSAQDPNFLPGLKMVFCLIEHMEMCPETQWHTWHANHSLPGRGSGRQVGHKQHLSGWLILAKGTQGSPSQALGVGVGVGGIVNIGPPLSDLLLQSEKTGSYRYCREPGATGKGHARNAELPPFLELTPTAHTTTLLQKPGPPMHILGRGCGHPPSGSPEARSSPPPTTASPLLNTVPSLPSAPILRDIFHPPPCYTGVGCCARLAVARKAIPAHPLLLPRGLLPLSGEGFPPDHCSPHRSARGPNSQTKRTLPEDDACSWPMCSLHLEACVPWSHLSGVFRFSDQTLLPSLALIWMSHNLRPDVGRERGLLRQTKLGRSSSPTTGQLNSRSPCLAFNVPTARHRHSVLGPLEVRGSGGLKESGPWPKEGEARRLPPEGQLLCPEGSSDHARRFGDRKRTTTSPALSGTAGQMNEHLTAQQAQVLKNEGKDSVQRAEPRRTAGPGHVAAGRVHGRPGSRSQVAWHLGFGASPKEAVTWEQACAKLGAAGEEGGWLTGRRVTAHQWRGGWPPTSHEWV